MDSIPVGGANMAERVCEALWVVVTPQEMS